MDVYYIIFVVKFLKKLKIIQIDCEINKIEEKYSKRFTDIMQL